MVSNEIGSDCGSLSGLFVAVAGEVWIAKELAASPASFRICRKSKQLEMRTFCNSSIQQPDLKGGVQSARLVRTVRILPCSPRSVAWLAR